MSKKAVRFQQRIGNMIGSGLYTRDGFPRGSDEKSLSPIEQGRLKSAYKLARIRRVFEIEELISESLSRGENVGALREELTKVKSGEMHVPLSLARDPRPPHDHVAVTANRKMGAERVPLNVGRHSRRHPPDWLTEKQVELVLKDLARSKITIDCIKIAKIMLDRFETELVSEIFGISVDLMEKIRASPLYLAAPEISAREALVIVDVLEARMSFDQPDEVGVPPLVEEVGGSPALHGQSLLQTEVAADQVEQAEEPKKSRPTLSLRSDGESRPTNNIGGLRAVNINRTSARGARKRIVERPSEQLGSEINTPTQIKGSSPEPSPMHEFEAPYEDRVEQLRQRRASLKVGMQCALEALRTIEQELSELDRELGQLTAEL